jgi:UDP-2-acetamido-3-amino-2,3-dideoxy-glucuronate N-acetyltransferase
VKSPEPRVDPSANVHPSVKIWAGSQIRESASISEGTSIGQYVYVGPGVTVGKNCKIQNHALIYEPAQIGDGVFIGPGTIFTNDLQPRAVLPDGTPKTESDWKRVGVIINDGASIGAGAVCVAPVTLGDWCMVAAGAVVSESVAPYALVAGVPARQIGWVGEAGAKLEARSDGRLLCPSSGRLYELTNDGLSPITNQ